MTDSDLFGYERRQKKLKEAQKKENEYTVEITKEICEREWQNFINELKVDSVKDYAIEASDEQIDNLYIKILQCLEEQLKQTQIPVALACRLRFFNVINKKRTKANLKPFPTPVIASQPKRPANTNDLENFLYLERAIQIVNDAMAVWQNERNFSQLDSVTWLLFSLIVFGGYNEESVIRATFDSLQSKKTIYHIGEEQLFIPIDIVSTEYANDKTQPNKEQPDDVLLSYSRWVFINDVARLWLAYISNRYSNSKKFPTYEACICQLSKFVGEKFQPKNFANSDFLKHINIYWQTLPNVRIDQKLVQTQLGFQRHTAVTFNQLLRYFSPIKPKLRNYAPLPISDSEQKQTSYVAMNEDINNKVNTTDVFKDDIFKVARKILNGEKSHIITQLEKLYLKQSLLPNQQRLIKWLIDLANKRLKPSTLNRYLSEIGNDFLAETRDTDFVGLQDYEYKYIYDKIVSQKNTLRMGYTQTVLASLHDVLVKEFDAPYVRLNREEDPLIVHSCLIPVTLYHYMLTQLDSDQSISTDLKSTLKLILILLYRTGMRFAEVLSLRVSDIEYDNLKLLHYNIILRPHSHRELKSDDATRRFILNVLLQPDELKEFEQYFLNKIKQDAKFLFTLPYHANPIDRNSVELPFREILRHSSLNGHYNDITMHSFRHNAISTMAIILRCDYSVIELFTDYSKEQAEAIRQHGLGSRRNTSPNFWNMLQDFSGHADLNTTFSSYIHTADVITHYQLSKAKLQLPLDTVIKLSGKARRSFNEYDKKAVEFDSEMVNLRYIRGFINNLIPSFKLRRNKYSRQAISQLQEQTLGKKQTVAQASAVFGKYQRKDVEKLLEDMEAGMDLSIASKPNIDYADALMIYQNALKLVEDEKSKHKLISKIRQPKHSHPIITPTALHYDQERQLLNRCDISIEQLCQSKAGKRELAEFVKTFYKKTIPVKPEIRFPFKETKQFYAYLDTALKILPSEYWRINICKYTPTKIPDSRPGEKSLDMTIDKKETQQAMISFRKKYPDFKGDITQKPIYSGFSISLIRPDKKGKPTKSQPSSVLIKYLVHWLLIMGWEKM